MGEMRDFLHRDIALGNAMYDFAKELFPICRSITGDGVRQTLSLIRDHLPDLIQHNIPSGVQVFDWTVPNEWNIRGGHLLGPDGRKVIDFRDNNLHVVGYSEPVDAELTLEELQPHLYSLPEQPDAIPYITSYYKRHWGFCLQHRVRETLKPGLYHAVIDSTLAPGHLTFGELILPGEKEKEVFLSTYICHPSMANNEISGPVVTTWLTKWLMERTRQYTYRIVFIPETIGSIAYLNQNLSHMKEATIAGFNITCVGDDRCFSFLPTRHGLTLSDRVAMHVLKYIAPNYNSYTFLDRGSDERQYNAPGVDLPVCCVMRSKFGQYPEYHTSLDNLDLITPAGLAGSLMALLKCLECLEHNDTFKTTVVCEPQLSKRGLYPTLSTRDSTKSVDNMVNFLAYCDGDHDVLSIADIIDVPMWDLYDAIERLKECGLLESVV
jgi:aminopeptidase-like protein